MNHIDSYQTFKQTLIDVVWQVKIYFHRFFVRELSLIKLCVCVCDSNGARVFSFIVLNNRKGNRYNDEIK